MKATYELQHGSGSASEVYDGCFCSVVLRVSLVGIYACYAGSRNNPSTRNRVLSHEMNSKLSSINHSFVVDISAGQVWRWRDSVDNLAPG